MGVVVFVFVVVVFQIVLLFVFVILLFTIVVLTTSTTTAQSTSSSWVTIETYNEPQCNLDSSSIGGIVMQSGDCVQGQQVTCNSNNDIITVQEFNDQECQTTAANVTQYTSGVCNTVSQVHGFYKTYTCSPTMPSLPARSLSISTYSACKLNPSLLTGFRWIPSYKCMAIRRDEISGTATSASSSVGTSASASASSASASSGSASSGSVLLPYYNHDNHANKISSMDLLDKYFDFLDTINFNQLNGGQEDDNVGVLTQPPGGRLGTTGTGLTGSGVGFGTGTGDTSGSGPINFVSFGIVVCNQTDNKLFAYFNGNHPGSTSGTAGSVLSTGKYSSGDPYGSNMNVPTSVTTGWSGGTGATASSGRSATGGDGSATTATSGVSASGGSSASSSSGSGSASGSADYNGCSIPPNLFGGGKNVQQCYQNQLLSVTCTPPYHS
ncbi:hypothetical protein DFA_04408 [Cavenderia fasciculata]|uniref:Uncharacterized protein n=1 Tax=Cavenderia fasciculata TaxID=261658 RepID=F4PPH7_CACFS|nr:uncharacterized protein DFA_04408 [Cavenderia fasciculata]EGG22290.1 hypothetical protein DFA_04408 [Cavenderia fasciculata]|eukprot:XP_004360141.1 hypothetical protein DFA_04408 [Cavenderia fasciculata]